MKKQSYLSFALLFFFGGMVHAQGVDSTKILLEKEKESWNRRLTRDTTYKFNKGPNALLVEVSKTMKPGAALDVGMGQGRNSIYLAQQGWQVTGFDIANEAVAVALAKAKQENLRIKATLEPIETFDFGVSQWNLIAYVYEGCIEEADLFRIKKSLKPGGVIVFEFFHREAGLKMKRPDFGCETGSIKKLFERVGGFNIIRYEETESVADYSLRPYKMVKLVAEKK